MSSRHLPANWDCILPAAHGERFAAVGGDIVGPESRDRPAQSRSARGRSHGTSWLGRYVSFSGRGTRRLVWNWRGELVSLVSTAEVGGSITDKGILKLLELDLTGLRRESCSDR